MFPHETHNRYDPLFGFLVILRSHYHLFFLFMNDTLIYLSDVDQLSILQQLVNYDTYFLEKIKDNFGKH